VKALPFARLTPFSTVPFYRRQWKFNGINKKGCDVIIMVIMQCKPMLYGKNKSARLGAAQQSATSSCYWASQISSSMQIGGAA
jgi:hypothetical protein